MYGKLGFRKLRQMLVLLLDFLFISHRLPKFGWALDLLSNASSPAFFPFQLVCEQRLQRVESSKSEKIIVFKFLIKWKRYRLS